MIKGRKEIPRPGQSDRRSLFINASMLLVEGRGGRARAAGRIREKYTRVKLGNCTAAARAATAESKESK